MTRPTCEQLQHWDKEYVWHPFTQMRDYLSEDPVVIVEGEGAMLKDAAGNEYIDGVASLWCNVHGHRKGEIDAAIRDQLARIAHTTLLGLANVPSILLAKRLAEITPPGLNKVFFSDNGSTAMEVAIKIAFQYWQHKGSEHRRRTRFISLDNGYHGDTIGAVSVGGIDLFHEMYRPLLFETFRAPSPYCYRCPCGPREEGPDRCGMACLEEMRRILDKHADEVAAVVLEPMVQGAGGMIVHPPGYLKGVSALCREFGVLFIADEVAVGFGRTGRMFACEHEGVTPDMLALSKGLTGGYLPLAATLTTDEVYEAFLAPYAECKTFFHGHTFTGNPLGCAAALANVELFENDRVLENLRPKIDLMREHFERIATLAYVGDTRQCGLLGGIELVRDKTTREEYAWEEKMGIRACLAARPRGVLLRPLGNVVVIMPPLNITLDQLERLLCAVYESIREVTEGTTHC